jgi:hypothetical protein
VFTIYYVMGVFFQAIPLHCSLILFNRYALHILSQALLLHNCPILHTTYYFESFLWGTTITPHSVSTHKLQCPVCFFPNTSITLESNSAHYILFCECFYADIVITPQSNSAIYYTLVFFISGTAITIPYNFAHSLLCPMLALMYLYMYSISADHLLCPACFMPDTIIHCSNCAQNLLCPAYFFPCTTISLHYVCAL